MIHKIIQQIYQISSYTSQFLLVTTTFLRSSTKSSLLVEQNNVQIWSFNSIDIEIPPIVVKYFVVHTSLEKNIFIKNLVGGGSPSKTLPPSCCSLRHDKIVDEIHKISLFFIKIPSKNS